jgi:hypothetical protein
MSYGGVYNLQGNLKWGFHYEQILRERMKRMY